MTFRRNDDSWSFKKLIRFSIILTAVGTCVLAMPIAIDYGRAFASPWVSLPSKIDKLQSDMAEVKKSLGIRETFSGTNNATIAAK